MPTLLVEEGASLLRNLVGDGTDAVAVFLLGAKQHDGEFASFEPIRGHRYCQALMKDRHGGSVTLEPDGLACPAAAAAFRFRPLPAQLANGKGLIGFGIVGDTGAADVRRHAAACRTHRCKDRSVPTAVCTLHSRRCGSRRSGGVPDVAPARGSEHPWRRASGRKHCRTSGYVCRCGSDSPS